jgi:C1A family cysteine protease
MSIFGVPPEAAWPYFISKYDELPPIPAAIIGQSFQALNYLRLDPYGDQPRNLKLIKDWLAKGFPIQFGFSCYQSALNQADRNGHIPYPSTNDMRNGGHSVLAVGYDDNLNISNADNGRTTTGAILFRNSWGENWGSKGYGYLPYEYVLQELADDFWTVLSMEFIDLKLFDW